MTNPNLPASLYLPTGHPSDNLNVADVELHATSDNLTALLAFTTLEKLVSCCGEYQPWALVDTRNLPTIHQARKYDVIALDAYLSEERRHRPIADSRQ